MATLIVIPGLTSTTKRPAFYGQIVNPAGKISASSIPLILLLVGNKTSAGTMTADGTPIQIQSAEEADTYAGAGSELACMAYGIGGTGAHGGTAGGALATQNVQIWLGCVTEASSSPAFSTATVTITGSWTTAGTVYYRLDGITLPISVGASDTVTDVAGNIKSAINGNARLPFTADNIAGVLTVTSKNKSLRANWHCIFQTTTLAPSGFTSTLAGGTSMTGGGKRFTGGLGSDSPVSLLAVIAPTQFDRIAVACGDNTLDTTQLALWKTQLNNQAAPTVGILEQLVCASTDSLANAASITVTTLNHTRFEMLWGLNVETHPSVIASTFAATRTAAETRDPNAYYDSLVAPDSLPGIAGQTQSADRASNSTQETALGEGVTPLLTMPDGTVRICRAITTYCRNGTNPDYRALDTNQTTVPDYVMTALSLEWTTNFLPSNPRVEDNPAPEVPALTSGVAYPDLWNATVQAILNNFTTGKGLPTGLPILDANATAANPPVSQFDNIGKFIVSAVSVVPAANQHIMGISVRNVTSV